MNVLKKIVIFVLLALICGIFFIFCMKKDDIQPESSIILSSESEREAYLNIKGWDVTAVITEEITIPADFEGLYKSYAQIQEKQKLPLDKYKGKPAERFLYCVNNYNGDTEIYAELLISEERLIAAALIEQTPDGFVKPVY